MGLEDELADPTWRFSTLNLSWDEERAALKADRVEASNRIDGLARELVQMRAYINSTLSMEYG